MSHEEFVTESYWQCPRCMREQTGTAINDGIDGYCVECSLRRLLEAASKDAGGDPNVEAICHRCKAVKAFSGFPPSSLVTGRFMCRDCDSARNEQRSASRAVVTKTVRALRQACLCGHGPRLHPFRRSIGRRTSCIKCHCAEYIKKQPVAILPDVRPERNYWERVDEAIAEWKDQQ